MNVTIKLSEEQAAAIKIQAAARGLSVEEWLQELAAQSAAEDSAEAGGHQPPSPIWDVIADTMRDVPDEEFAAIPEDGLRQLDHYVYGVPKREQ